MFSILFTRRGQKDIEKLPYPIQGRIKNKLLDRRDNFIARRIDETLQHGEKGIIFIGAYHNVKKRLPKSIQIKEVKDAEKVREYQKLLPFCKKHKERFEALEKYLISSIDEKAIDY